MGKGREGRGRSQAWLHQCEDDDLVVASLGTLFLFPSALPPTSDMPSYFLPSSLDSSSDFFRVEDVSKVALAGIDAVTSFTALGTDSILLRNYHVQYKKSGGRVPNVVLEPMGPNFTLTVRRHQLAAPDLWRTACKQARGGEGGVKKKVKNESTNVFGDKMGRIHLGRQDLGAMKVKRVKALRKGKVEGDEGEGVGEAMEESGGEESDGEEEKGESDDE